MKIIHLATSTVIDALVCEVQVSELTKIRQEAAFSFDWVIERNKLLYKITPKAEEDNILGLISMTDYPRELRIHIDLLELSKHQVGKSKTYDNLAGCLLAQACALSFMKGYGGFVSLLPKTSLSALYQQKYGFKPYGKYLALELEQAQIIIDKYKGND
jgi:hypothetical protein